MKWSMGNPSQSCDHAMTSPDPERSNAWPHFVARITYTVLVETLNPAQSINQSRVTTIRSEPNLFENSWRCNSATIANYWPNLLWDSTVGYPSDSLASSSCLVNDVIHTIIFKEINALTPVPYILLAMVDNGYLSSWWLQHDHGLTAVSNCTG